MKPILTESDLQEVTKLSQPAAQARLLRVWGVPFRVRSDGSLVTTWDAINAALMTGGQARPNLQAARKAG